MIPFNTALSSKEVAVTNGAGNVHIMSIFP